jgi:integrase
MELKTRLEQANQRLKEDGYRLSITLNTRGNLLMLRGIFPPKPGGAKNYPYQQRLALGLPANPRGVKEAEREAKYIGALLERREFLWDKYLVHHKQDDSDTCGEWIARFEKHYFSRRKRTHQTETTWQLDYLNVLKKLPAENSITSDLLEEIILTTEPDSRTRKRVCMVYKALAQFANLELDTKDLKGSYAPREKNPLELPDDNLITQCYHSIINPKWRWVYGLISTYGLRPHEAFRIELEPLINGDRILRVQENTKTGYREVYPLYPEWFDEFKISDVSPPPINTNRRNADVGNAVTQYLRRDAKLPFQPYALRHAWAIRSIGFNIPVALAAQQMGHGVDVHTKTYHRWLTREHHQRVFEALMSRHDRPLPPC